MLQSVIIVRVADHPRLCSSLPSWTDDLQHCSVRANRVRHSTHNSLTKSLFRVCAFRSNNRTSESSRILNPRLASSTTCNLRSLRNQIVVGAPLAFRARASLAEVLRCCRPSRPSWKRVVVGWAMFSRAAYTHKSQGTESWIRETRHPSQHARTTHWDRTANLHPRMCSLQARGGEAQCRPLTQGRILYTIGDVSSGPRPRAHWYMLTHLCCDSAAPYWTPHSAAPSSGPTATPLQRLSTSCHQVQP